MCLVGNAITQMTVVSRKNCKKWPSTIHRCQLSWPAWQLKTRLVRSLTFFKDSICYFYIKPSCLITSSVSAVHSAIDQLSCCLHDVDVWMSASWLCLNASKTQMLWLGSRQNIDRGTSLVIYSRRRRLSTRPRRCHWQPVVNGRPRGVSLSLSILSPAAD